MKKFGRSMKYDYIILELEDDTLYTAASIASFAQANGLLRGEEESQQLAEKRRIRLALGRIADTRNFPQTGDGSVQLKGQAPTPAWFGWRWRSVIE